MLDAAIVGLGRWGQRLVSSCQGKSEVIRFTAGVTRTPAKSADFARQHGFPLGSDYTAVLADKAIQAVVLATPHSQHAEQVKQAASAGKHVFVEKPFTLDKASAEAAVAAARAAKVVLAYGHNRRFLPAINDLRLLIADGELGEILHIEGHFSAPGALGYQKGNWRADPAETPAGGMTGLGIHVVDAFIYLLGDIAAVTAAATKRVLPIELDDTTVVLLRFRRGMLGALTTMIATAPLFRIQVFGTKGWAELRGADLLTVQRLERDPETTDYPATDIERAELESFANATGGKARFPVTHEQAIHGVAVLEAVIRAAAAGQTTTVA